MAQDKRIISTWMSVELVTIGDDQTLAAARQRMLAQGVRHLAVLHGGHLVGVLSNRDISMAESLSGVDVELAPVSEAMTEEPWTVTPDARVAEVAEAMAEQRIGTAMVVGQAGSDELLGVFTTTDALRALAAFAS